MPTHIMDDCIGKFIKSKVVYAFSNAKSTIGHIHKVHGEGKVVVSHHGEIKTNQQCSLHVWCTNESSISRSACEHGMCCDVCLYQ
jgi:hypothetical protein